MSALVTLATDGAIATLMLARPEKLNAIGPEMLEQLEATLAAIEADASIRCVLVAAAGDRAFSVGGDVKTFSALPPVEMWRHWTRLGHRVFDRLAALRQPTIAVIDGPALGGGLELAIACDLRVAAPRAVFALPEVTIATCPGWGGTVRLARLVGHGRAKQMVLTGERIDAQTAHAWGLVNAIADDALAHARALADRIAANAPVSVQIAKSLVDAAAEPHQGARTLEMLAGAVAASTGDAAEGIRALNDRRPPAFTGR